MRSVEIIVLFTFLPFCAAHNFLVLHPPSTASHVKSIFPITKELTRRGHSVTTVRWETIQGIMLPPLVNHTDIVLSINNTDGKIPFVTQEERGVFLINEWFRWETALNLYENFWYLESNPWNFYTAVCRIFYNDHRLMEYVRANHFDVAIVDLITNECMLALPASLDIPVVGFWVTLPVSGAMEASTQPSNPSYVPYGMTGFTDKMGFLTRVQNCIYKFLHTMLMQYHWHVTDRVVSEFIPDSPSSTQMIANISGCLVNSHSVFEVPMPRLPTYINILGTTIEKELRPLPKDIKDFMDGAEHGVVVLTMGMTYVPSDIPPHLERRLIKAFSQLKQRVIMKLHQIPSDLPSNIMVRKILPQQAIMAHPKTVLFFTHAGSNGVLEAIHYRVPMVGLPLYMNQEDMINRLIEKGIAEGVRKTSTAEEIHKALMRVIYNDSYKNNIEKMADLLALERNDPMDNALWLLEYVAETDGAEHLKAESRHLNYVQYLCLDVIAFILMVCYLGKRAFHRLRKRSQKLKID